ncbi:RNA-splicing ligase RtcB [Candidatus Marinamargulisbacteria bacterium SCGC AG-410-N11]|nr:RNA-splicing ligase RtcB [Candidatus Marinamargulisbacteria bacterium SCGC AG-410-N11]
MIFGNHNSNTLEQFNNIKKNAQKTALMADGHLGYVMPIGGVAAYKHKISPAGVGFDIACGNMAIQLDEPFANINLHWLLDQIESKISFGIGQTNPNAPCDHPLFSNDLWSAFPSSQIKSKMKDLAQKQLGTVGSGNHYVDIFEDDSGLTWIGVHFGSRGLGHHIASGFLSLAQTGQWNQPFKQIETLLDTTSDIGHRYLQCMTLAGQYAYAGREWVCQTIQDIIGAKRLYQVHNHHNYAWLENHEGDDYYVIRKGATPAFPGQEGFVGGSMGDDSVIIQGVDSTASQKALYSTIHGAGRVMSRTKAAGKSKWIKNKNGVKRPKHISTGAISWDMLNQWLSKKNVLLRGGGLDEAPQAYRRLEDVLAFHHGTIKIKHHLYLKAVVMAGEHEFDPYKD